MRLRRAAWLRLEKCKKLVTLLDLCVSSLRRGHANLLCIVPILTDDPRRESTGGVHRRQSTITFLAQFQKLLPRLALHRPKAFSRNAASPRSPLRGARNAPAASTCDVFALPARARFLSVRVLVTVRARGFACGFARACAREGARARERVRARACVRAHVLICACHPCAGAMLIFSVSFQF